MHPIYRKINSRNLGLLSKLGILTKLGLLFKLGNLSKTSSLSRILSKFEIKLKIKPRLFWAPWWTTFATGFAYCMIASITLLDKAQIPPSPSCLPTYDPKASI